MTPRPWVGQRLNRIDGPAKVRGQATFVADFELPGLVHAVLVGAGIAHGQVLSIDTAAARALPGVLDVLTHQSAGMQLQPLKGYPDGPAGTRVLPLQNADIEQRGQPVALVIAHTLEQAKHAALLLDIEYQQQRVTATLKDGLDSLPLLGRLPARALAHHRGQPEKLLAQPGGVRLEANYGTPQQHHNPLELHSTTAVWQGSHLRVYEPSQWMQAPQQALATTLGLQPDDVQVICPYIGGGFGSKATPWMHVALAALAARVVKRPVKLALTRAQMFSGVGYRPATIQRFQVGAEQDGRLRAAVLHADTQVGMSDAFPEQVGTLPRMLYALGHLTFTQQLVKTNAGAGIMMRAPGEASGQLRAGSDDGRAGEQPEGRSTGAAPEKLCRNRPGKRQTLQQQTSARMLRPGRAALRLGAAQPAAGQHEGRRHADRLGHGDGGVSGVRVARHRPRVGRSGRRHGRGRKPRTRHRNVYHPGADRRRRAGRGRAGHRGEARRFRPAEERLLGRLAHGGAAWGARCWRRQTDCAPN